MKSVNWLYSDIGFLAVGPGIESMHTLTRNAWVLLTYSPYQYSTFFNNLFVALKFVSKVDPSFDSEY